MKRIYTRVDKLTMHWIKQEPEQFRIEITIDKGLTSTTTIVATDWPLKNFVKMMVKDIRKVNKDCSLCVDVFGRKDSQLLYRVQTEDYPFEIDA